jgi:putative addiction module killer protein
VFFIEKTNEFDKWLRGLRDLNAKARILFRIQKLEREEHFGDCKMVGEGIREMRVDVGKGYRVYFKEKGGKIIILLVGGDKSTQQKDIKKAKEMWAKLKDS